MFDAMLRDTVTIRRASAAGSRTPSSTGAVKEVWRDIKTGVAASVQPASGRFDSREGGQKLGRALRIFLKAGEDVQAGDEITHGGRVYQVTFVNAVHGHHLELDARTKDE